MGKGGFRREANSKMLNHNRTQPVQESHENGKALPAFRSLEGSCGEMDMARLCCHQGEIETESQSRLVQTQKQEGAGINTGTPQSLLQKEQL